MRILVTGAAGFIGFHSTKKLLELGHDVLGFDNVNDYYDPDIKESRINYLRDFSGFEFKRADIADQPALELAWQHYDPEVVLHLAAQAGVRYSIEQPSAYVHSNLVGFQNVIELARHCRVKNMVYASSSSVYGGNKKLPFDESQDVSNPISFYAATKLENELVAKCYGNLYQLATTGMRFFTVYGPFGRPDMAMFKFADLMRRGLPIPLYNSAKMIRDFTYVDDIVDGVVSALMKPQISQVYNLGRGEQIDLLRVVEYLEEGLGLKSERVMLPMQAGDVEATLADISKARRDLAYDPKVSVREGVARFTAWYLSSVATRAIK